jgi:asparagine synthase (glutamine-hydrolysing)
MAAVLADHENPLGLTPLEIASGRPFDGEPLALPADERGKGPREALERRLRDELARGRCVVALSGGRDSSAVLALAAEVARREGLAPPAAVSLSFPGLPTDESVWQEQVVRAAGVDEWERVAIADELDFVGPVAGPLLRRLGLLYPAHAHLYAPILERARGGTVLTGIGGDEAVEAWRFERLAAALRGQRRPDRADARSLALWALPRPLRRAALLRLSHERLPWLSDEGRLAYRAARAASQAAAPRLWPASVALSAGRRGVALTQAALDRLAEALGARIAHPLLDPDWLAALSASGGTLGPGGRERLWPRLFGGLLPGLALRRPDKADYHGVYFAGPSREFAENWDGTGLSGGLVDPERLRATWRSEWWCHTPGLLQQALWLARAR